MLIAIFLGLGAICLFIIAFKILISFKQTQEYNQKALDTAIECKKQIAKNKEILNRILSDPNVSNGMKERIEEVLIWSKF